MTANYGTGSSISTMTPVIQLERTGCGIASVATIAGLSYAKAKSVANALGIHAEDDTL